MRLLDDRIGGRRRIEYPRNRSNPRWRTPINENGKLGAEPLGLQENGGSSEGTGRVTTADLLTSTKDPAVTERTLEFWRHQGLLPKASRTGQRGKHPEWTYPVEAVDQLGALLRLRVKTKDPDQLRVGLWFEGYPVDIARVCASIVGLLTDKLALLTKEVDKCRDPEATSDDAKWTALERVGGILAGMRGPKAPPRYGRQPRHERERAMTLLLGLAIGDERAAARLEHDADQVERMIGLDRGRRSRAGLPPWLDGAPAEGLGIFAHLGGLPALIDTMKSVTDEGLAASRILARTLLDGIAAFSKIADAFTQIDNATGFGAITILRSDPMAAVWMLTIVVAAGRSSTLNEGLRSVVDSISQRVMPLDTQARELAGLSEDVLRIRLPELDRLPFAQQMQIKRLVKKYRDTSVQMRYEKGGTPSGSAMK